MKPRAGLLMYANKPTCLPLSRCYWRSSRCHGADHVVNVWSSMVLLINNIHMYLSLWLTKKSVLQVDGSWIYSTIPGNLGFLPFSWKMWVHKWLSLGKCKKHEVLSQKMCYHPPGELIFFWNSPSRCRLISKPWANYAVVLRSQRNCHSELLLLLSY